MPKRQRLLIFCLAVLPLWGSLASPLWSFESNEHRLLGNTSLRIALDHFFATSDHADDDALRTATYCLLPYEDDLSNSCEDVLRDRPTYGYLSEFVDYRVDPRTIFLPNSTDKSETPKSVSDLNLEREVFDWVAPLHSNDSHFQNNLMNAQRFWHLKALDQALALHRDSSISEALMTNAISDHYLHDFFAPGHITTNRRNSQNTLALGYHDAGNILGGTFIVDASYWNKKIAPFLESVYRRANSENCPYDGDETYLCLIIEFLKKDPQVKSLLSVDEGTIVFKLRGDGFLERKAVERENGDHVDPDTYFEHDRVKQIILMSLIGARSIQEVLSAHVSCRSRSLRDCVRESDFAAYEWQIGNGQTSPEAEISGIGSYEIDPSNVGLAADLLSLSGAYGSFLDKEDGFRLDATLELLFPWFNRDRNAWFVPYFGVGYTHILANNHSGHGPVGRIMMALPQLNSEVGVYYRHIGYHRPGDRRWRPGYGLRFDYGFSLFDFYATIGQEYLFGSADNFQRGPQLAFGLEYSIPLSRLGIPFGPDWLNEPITEGAIAASEFSLKSRRTIRDQFRRWWMTD